MNKIINMFLLAGDKFMPEIHLRQLGFTSCACRSSKKKQRKNTSLKKQKIQDIFIKTR